MTFAPENDIRLDWLDLRCGNLEPGKQVRMPMLSGSMMPLIAPGCEILIESIDWKNCRQGDVVVFSDNENLVAHRLLLRVPLGPNSLIYQKGDFNEFGSWIKASQVVGRVVICFGQDVKNVDSAVQRVVADNSWQSEHQARSQARRQLIRDLLARALYLPRRAKKWLTGGE